MGPTLARRHDDGERASRLLDWVIYLLVIAVVGVGALGAHDIVFKATGVAGQERSTAQRVADVFRPPFPNRDRVRILLMGADKRPGDEGRSDTILLLSINPRTNKAAILGIPRDLKVYIPGHGQDKINHSYFYGGIDLTRECVEELIGAHIHHYGLVYFHGFVKAVDRLGGVWVDVPDIEGKGRGMNYDEGVVVMRTHIDHDGHLHVHLKPGVQKLDGAGALGFVRYRKSTMYGDGRGNWAGDSDFARSARQQQFLRAMARQHLRVANVHNLLAAASEIAPYITSDLKKDWNDVYDLLRVLKEVDPHDLWTGTLPVADDPNFFHGGVYYALLQEDEFRQMKLEMERHLDGTTTTLGEVEVLNASGVAGSAHDAAERLATKGFSVTSVGNAEAFDLKETEVQYTEGFKRDARMAANVLACGEIAPMEDRAEGTETGTEPPGVRVLLGADYDPDAAAVAAGEIDEEVMQEAHATH
jgi:LCP family protein required for cell wall assembly